MVCGKLSNQRAFYIVLQSDKALSDNILCFFFFVLTWADLMVMQETSECKILS